MKHVGAISTAVLSLFLGATALGYAPQDEQGGKQKARHDEKKKPEEKNGRQGKPDKAKPDKPERQAKTDAPPPQRVRSAPQPRRAEPAPQPQRVAPTQRVEPTPRAQPQPAREARLPQPRQQQLVAQQQQRLTQYRLDLDRQQIVLQQQAVQLEQQKRTAQYRIQVQYVDRLRQQQVFLQNDRHPDYERDPYFYTAPIYRYRRDGRYYTTNQYGADLFRQAVNFGYQEGFQTGDADRQDRWAPNYRASYAYQDANYGYSGYYVARADYNYYFREGFRRGYEDGYGSRYRYGRVANGSYSLLDAILSQVLGFQAIR